MRRRVVWIKYVDPLNSNIEEVEFPGFGKVTTYDEEASKVAASNGEYNPDDDEEERIYKIDKKKLLFCELGVLSLTNNTMVSKQIDLWEMHTNFDLTVDIVSQLEMVEGVEALNVLTRYRLLVGFPRSGLFTASGTKLAMEAVIDAHNEAVDKAHDTHLEQLFDKETSLIVSKLRESFAEKPYWSIFVLPNGEIDSVVSDQPDKTFKSKIQLFTEAKKSAGGYILSSADY